MKHILIVIALGFALFLFAAMLNRCEAADFNVKLSPETSVEEAVWQAMNVVDTFQTVQMTKNPACYKEVGQVAWFYGPHPTERQAIGTLAVFGLIHFGVTELIEHVGPRWAQRAWQATNIGYKAHVIIDNADYGLDFDHSRSCL